MKHSRSDYDCIQDPSGLIPEDEPVFILRAQDNIAWAAVIFWAEQARRQGCDPEMVRNALEQAERMRDWPKKKNPDLPSGAGFQPADPAAA